MLPLRWLDPVTYCTVWHPECKFICVFTVHVSAHVSIKAFPFWSPPLFQFLKRPVCHRHVPEAWTLSQQRILLPPLLPPTLPSNPALINPNQICSLLPTIQRQLIIVGLSLYHVSVKISVPTLAEDITDCFSSLSSYRNEQHGHLTQLFPGCCK